MPKMIRMIFAIGGLAIAGLLAAGPPGLPEPGGSGTVAHAGGSQGAKTMTQEKTPGNPASARASASASAHASSSATTGAAGSECAAEASASVEVNGERRSVREARQSRDGGACRSRADAEARIDGPGGQGGDGSGQ